MIIIDSQKKLYETHIPIPFKQRALLAAGSALTALLDPLRGGNVRICLF